MVEYICCATFPRSSLVSQKPGEDWTETLHYALMSTHANCFFVSWGKFFLSRDTAKDFDGNLFVANILALVDVKIRTTGDGRTPRVGETFAQKRYQWLQHGWVLLLITNLFRTEFSGLELGVLFRLVDQSELLKESELGYVYLMVWHLTALLSLAFWFKGPGRASFDSLVIRNICEITPSFGFWNR
jgi:hypothetical protein